MYFVLRDVRLSIKVTEMFSTDHIVKIRNSIIINFTGTPILLPSSVVVFHWIRVLIDYE